MITGYEKVLLINSEDFVSQKHICYYTANNDGQNIELIEVLKVTYRHPEARDDAIVTMLETRHRGSYRCLDRPDLVMLDGTQKVSKTLQAIKG